MVLQCYDQPPSLRSTPLHTEAAGAAPFDTFGPFRVLHQIGAGTLGPVFRAYDPDQDRLVAVKLFQLNLSPERVHQLVDGLQRLIDADLAHPALSAPLATGLAGVSAFLAQDFVAADSLDVVIREFGPLSVADAARVAGQLAGALDFAAGAGVYHGALHPRDVLLSADDARLTGLGVTQVLDRLGVPSAMRRPYTAPERLAGQPWDRRADVFSLGALLVEMLTGRRLTGTGAKGVEGLPDVAGDDPAALRHVLARAIADRPGDRYETADALADAVRNLAGSAEADRPEGKPPGNRSLVADRPVPPDVAPRLPLDEPVTGIVEMPLPGDVPLDREVEPAWEVPLALTPVSTTPSGDLELREPERSPASVALPLDVPSAAATVRPARDAAPADRPSRPVASQPRVDPAPGSTHSAVWPLSLALTVGLIVGIALGFFIFAQRGALETEAALASGSAAGSGAGASDGVAPVAAAVSSGSPLPSAAAPAAPPPTAESPASPAQSASPTLTAPPAATSAPAATTSAPVDSARPPAPPSRPAPEAARPAERPRSTTVEPKRNPVVVGRLLVRTSPAGARVLLDGQDVGVTPLTLRSLPFGTHTLRVTREGYESESRRVIISTAQPAPSLIVDLTRTRGGVAAAGGPDSRFTASLAVESRPPGANVYLDGRRIGTTPLVLDAAPTGSHALRLELDGYRRWTSSVRVAAGERNRVTASLEQ